MAETIKERGFFWWFNEGTLPARSKETSVAGQLTVSDQGGITLETDGALCLKEEFQNWSEPRNFAESRRITGVLATSESSDTHVLLETLERTDLSLPDDSPQRQKFSAQLCTTRDCAFPASYPEGFTELRVSLDGFEEWLELKSIVVEQESWESDAVDVLVSYKQWRFEYPTPGGTISVESITTGALPFFSDLPRTSAEFHEHFYLIFRPNSPSDASTLRYLYTKIEEFLAVLAGKYHRLPSPILTTEDEFGTWNTVHFYRSTPLEHLNRFSVWLTFPQIKDAFGELFKNWLSGCQLFGAGYYLFVSALRNPHQYSEHRFVNLLWGIEALHRKWLGESETSDRVIREKKRVGEILNLLPEDDRNRKWLGKKLAHAHELSLEERILECFRRLPFTFGSGEIEKFAKVCAERRNDISHFGGPRGDVDYDLFHSQISQLADALDHLFRLLLLHQIGVDAKTLFKVVTDSFVSRNVGVAFENVGLSIKSAVQGEGVPSIEVPQN